MQAPLHPTYNDDRSLGRVNQNFFDGKVAGEFPRRLYSSIINPPSQYLCQSGPRDKKIDYILHYEHPLPHPDYFSRFEYAYFPNGYGFGNWPGRYVTPESMQWMVKEPENMAPQRLYEPPYLDPTFVEGEAYKGSRDARRLRS